MSSWRLKVYIFKLGSLVVGAGLLLVMVLTTVPCLSSNPPKHPLQHPSRIKLANIPANSKSFDQLLRSSGFHNVTCELAPSTSTSPSITRSTK